MWDLLKPPFNQITFRLWVIMSCYCFFASGIIFIQPFLLHDIGGNSGLFLMLLMLVMEFPALIFSYMVIDNPEYGRRKSSTLASLGLFCVLGTLFFGREPTLIIGLLFVFFLQRVLIVSLMTTILESYNTTYRGRGLGMCFLIGNIICSIVPQIIWRCY